MREHSKSIRRELRELNAAAHEAALRRALLPLADRFEEWKQGKLGSGELAELIHEFHHGPSRKLFNQYVTAHTMLEWNVAGALLEGLLERSQMSPEVLSLVETHRALLERHRSGEEPPDASFPD